MDQKIIKGADIAMGSSGVPVSITTNLDISAYALTELQFIFIKPSGAILYGTPAVIENNYTAIYYTFTSDIDEEGEWQVFLKNLRTGYEFVKGNSSFTARPAAEDMASSNG